MYIRYVHFQFWLSIKKFKLRDPFLHSNKEQKQKQKYRNKLELEAKSKLSILTSLHYKYLGLCFLILLFSNYELN